MTTELLLYEPDALVRIQPALLISHYVLNLEGESYAKNGYGRFAENKALMVTQLKHTIHKILGGGIGRRLL